MKRLFSKFFTSEPASPVPAKPARTTQANVDQLRQTLLAATENDRPQHEAALGEALGRAGLRPEASDATNVWIGAICHSTDKNSGLEWLATLNDEDSLERVVLHARSADIRQTAIKRVADFERLKRIADSMRAKDKGVYRHCAALLKSHEETGKRAQEIGALTQDIENLLLLRPIPAKQLFDLRKRVTAHGEAEELSHCRALLQQATEREQQEARSVRQLQNHLSEAKSLLDALTKASPNESEGENPRPRLEQICQAMFGYPDWLQGHAELQELKNLLATVESKLDASERDQTWAAACQDFLTEHATAEMTPDLANAWAQLPKPENPALRSALSAQWESRKSAQQLIRPAKPAAPKPAKAPRHTLDIEAFKQKLGELEQAIDHGELQTAINLARELDDMTAGTQPPRAQLDHYRDLHAQLGRLRDWARWSGTRARDELIDAAESLLTIEPDVARLAEEVPQLRAEWRRLDSQGMPTGAQRKRFDTALTQAFQPVLAHRAERSARAEEVRQNKSAFVGEAEAWFNGLDWEQTAINAVQAHRDALRGKWRTFGHAHGRDERKLNSRFDELMAAIDAKVTPFVTEEIARRERMIQAAHRLETVTELNDAIAQARQLQQRWKDEAKPIQTPRKESDEQWQKFRLAIDAVFARRNAERADQAAKAQEHTTARQTLLNGFEAVLQSNPGMAQLENDLAEFRERWSEAAPQADEKRGPRRDNLDHQANGLTKQAEASLKELKAAKQMELFDTMAAKSALTAKLEQAACDDAWTDQLLEDTRQAWAALPALPGDIERKLTSRMEKAKQATSDTLDAGHTSRDSALLDLEILLDLPTPPEFASARQTRQLELLQQGFRDRKSSTALLDTVVGWHATAALDHASQAARIKAITAKLAGL